MMKFGAPARPRDSRSSRGGDFSARAGVRSTALVVGVLISISCASVSSSSAPRELTGCDLGADPCRAYVAGVIDAGMANGTICGDVPDDEAMKIAAEAMRETSGENAAAVIGPALAARFPCATPTKISDPHRDGFSVSGNSPPTERNTR